MEIKLNSRHVHPWIFMVLIIPFGVVSGYVAVTLACQLQRSGVSVGQIAALVALGVLPHTWKFFWAPVIDVTLNQKKWHLLRVTTPFLKKSCVFSGTTRSGWCLSTGRRCPNHSPPTRFSNQGVGLGHEESGRGRCPGA